MGDPPNATDSTTGEPRIRVVLADDHPAVLEAFRRLLQPSCEVVASVSNGREALHAVTTLRPDVLVVDLMMPDVDGLEICRRVKQAAPETAVVIVTAFDDAYVRRVALQDGATEFVPKGLASERLEPAIQRLAGRTH